MIRHVMALPSRVGIKSVMKYYVGTGTVGHLGFERPTSYKDII